jgi:hypothetical protein
MTNLFDNIQRAAWGIVSNNMGYDASWQPVDGSDVQTARVLLKEPTAEYELGGIDYTPMTFIMEYQRPDFAAMFDSVAGGIIETVTVDGQAYYVRHVSAINDGKTYKAVLQRA